MQLYMLLSCRFACSAIKRQEVLLSADCGAFDLKWVGEMLRRRHKYHFNIKRLKPNHQGNNHVILLHLLGNRYFIVLSASWPTK